jgi:hypothetical protein
VKSKKKKKAQGENARHVNLQKKQGIKTSKEGPWSKCAEALQRVPAQPTLTVGAVRAHAVLMNTEDIIQGAVLFIGITPERSPGNRSKGDSSDHMKNW